MKILQNPRKLKNSPNLLLLFVKITKFLEFSIKITIKTIVFSNSGRNWLWQTLLHPGIRVSHYEIFLLFSKLIISNLSKFWQHFMTSLA